MWWKKKMLRNSSLILILIFFISCQEKRGNDANAVQIPDDFYSFYKKFHLDSIYQIDHIVFPLEGTPAPTDEMLSTTNFMWQKSDWKLHKPFEDMDGSFVREFRYYNGIVIEIIQDRMGYFEMKRRFSKIQGEWHLIYYQAIQQKPAIQSTASNA